MSKEQRQAVRFWEREAEDEKYQAIYSLGATAVTAAGAGASTTVAFAGHPEGFLAAAFMTGVSVLAGKSTISHLRSYGKMREMVITAYSNFSNAEKSKTR